MRYRADIDGLRALAVAPVVLFHAGVVGFSGGFIGVDVFFVISGYLITSIIINDINNGSFSIIDFYIRRCRRILPALITTIFAVMIIGYRLFLPPHFIDLSKSVVATAFFASNIYFWKFSGYFESSALLRPLLHTWSLAVEEQFYIFMPVALYLIAKTRKIWWWALFGFAAASSFALSVYMTTAAPTANFFLLPTRAWELLMGAMLALANFSPRQNNIARNLSALVGFSMIVLPVFVYTEATAFPGLTALPPCMGAAILIYTGSSDTWVSRLLSWRPIVFVGKISFSLYLVHWPITTFLRYQTLREPGSDTALLIVSSSLLLATASWHYIERPFRHGNVPLFGSFILPSSVAVLLVTAGLGVAGVVSEGFPDRFAGFKLAEDQSKKSWFLPNCFQETGGGSLPDWDAEACRIVGNGGDNVLLWGDSYMAHYIAGVQAAKADIPYNVYQYTAAACPPVIGYTAYAKQSCDEFNQRALDIIKRLDIKMVVLSGRWISLRARGLEQMKATMAALDAAGVKVYTIGQSPTFIADAAVIDFMNPDDLATTKKWPVGFDMSLNEELGAVVGVERFINPLPIVCDGDVCPYKSNGALLYADTGHLTQAGSELAVRAYFPLFTTANTSSSNDSASSEIIEVAKEVATDP